MRMGVDEPRHDDSGAQIHAAGVRVEDFEHVGVTHAENAVAAHGHGSLVDDVAPIVLGDHIVSRVERVAFVFHEVHSE